MQWYIQLCHCTFVLYGDDGFAVLDSLCLTRDATKLFQVAPAIGCLCSIGAAFRVFTSLAVFGDAASSTSFSYFSPLLEEQTAGLSERGAVRVTFVRFMWPTNVHNFVMIQRT
mmetsp:Transcript_14182/g.16562  ORF Transcript_14182/g.16562 Transcript_14182/m.16562 type:complete len:113 (+) Transcript_14182:300-638(+)